MELPIILFLFASSSFCFLVFTSTSLIMLPFDMHASVKFTPCPLLVPSVHVTWIQYRSCYRCETFFIPAALRKDFYLLYRGNKDFLSVESPVRRLRIAQTCEVISGVVPTFITLVEALEGLRGKIRTDPLFFVLILSSRLFEWSILAMERKGKEWMRCMRMGWLGAIGAPRPCQICLYC